MKTTLSLFLYAVDLRLSRHCDRAHCILRKITKGGKFILVSEVFFREVQKGIYAFKLCSA